MMSFILTDTVLPMLSRYFLTGTLGRQKSPLTGSKEQSDPGRFMFFQTYSLAGAYGNCCGIVSTGSGGGGGGVTLERSDSAVWFEEGERERDGCHNNSRVPL